MIQMIEINITKLSYIPGAESRAAYLYGLMDFVQLKWKLILGVCMLLCI